MPPAATGVRALGDLAGGALVDLGDPTTARAALAAAEGGC